MSMPPCGKPEECSYDPDVHKDIYRSIVYEHEAGVGICVSGTLDPQELEAEDLLALAQYWKDLASSAVALASAKDEELTVNFLLSGLAGLAGLAGKGTHPPMHLDRRVVPPPRRSS